MSKLHLPDNASLKEYQKYIEEMIQERGFEDENIAELLMLLMEECGELARACRKHTSIKTDINNIQEVNIQHELADIFMYILAIANKFKIDLEQAFRNKEEINKKRVWK